jgi:hypothetical protein
MHPSKSPRKQRQPKVLDAIVTAFFIGERVQPICLLLVCSTCGCEYLSCKGETSATSCRWQTDRFCSNVFVPARRRARPQWDTERWVAAACWLYCSRSASQESLYGASSKTSPNVYEFYELNVRRTHTTFCTGTPKSLLCTTIFVRPALGLARVHQVVDDQRNVALVELQLRGQESKRQHSQLCAQKSQNKRRTRYSLSSTSIKPCEKEEKKGTKQR